MGKFLAFLMCFSLWMISYSQSQETELQDQAYRKLGYAVKHAAHDATLQIIDSDLITDGVVRFDHLAAENVFKETLVKNLPLDNNLNPLHGYWFKDKLNVVSLEYLDADYLDPITGSNISFPFIYKYMNHTTGDINERVIFGPSIVAVVETQIVGKEDITREIVIQEYKQ